MGDFVTPDTYGSDNFLLKLNSTLTGQLPASFEEEYPRKDSAASKDEESPRTLTSIAEDDSVHEIRFSVLAEVRDPSDFSERPLHSSVAALIWGRRGPGKVS